MSARRVGDCERHDAEKRGLGSSARCTCPPEPVVHLDAETLMPIGVSTPCPSTATAHLGFKDPAGVRVPCGNLAGHDGPHVFHIEWTDPAPAPGLRTAGLRDRLDAAQPPLKRPR